MEELKKQIKEKVDNKTYPVEEILEDMEKNPKEYEKYLTMNHPITEIQTDWA